MIAFLIQTLRIAVPYLFAAAGGIVSERAGIIALTLEGFMLTGAFCATLGSYYSGSPWVGILAAIAGGLVAALLHALATIRYRADQVVVGIAMNLLAVGVTRFLAYPAAMNSSILAATLRASSVSPGPACAGSTPSSSARAA